MKFDLNTYRNENSDLFTEKSLDDVARHIYDNVSPQGAPEGKTFAQTGKFSDYNDFLAKTGLNSQVAAEKNQRNAPDRPGTWGVVRDVADQAVKSTGNIGGNLFNVAAGAVDSVGSAIGGFGRVLRDSELAKDSPTLRSVGEFASGAPDAFRGVSDVLNGVSSDARANGEAMLPRSRQMLRNDGYRDTLIGGLGSATESAIPMLAGGVLAKAWGARAAATKVFAAGTGAVSFGLSTFADAKREALQNGLSETDATIHATVQGVCETGSEFVGDLAYQFIGPAGGAVTQIGRKALQNGLSGLFRTSIAALGKDSLKSMAVEGGSELVNAYAQAEFANAAGMGQAGVDGKEISGMDAVRAQAGEIGVATLALALLGVHAGHRQRSNIKNYLTDPSVHPADKMELAKELGAEMNKLDSFGSSKPGTVGTEFIFSVERQLQETGTVSLTNNLEAAAQLEHEANTVGQEWDDPNNLTPLHDLGGEADRIMSEQPVEGDAPLGMAKNNDMPVDVLEHVASEDLTPGSLPADDLAITKPDISDADARWVAYSAGNISGGANAALSARADIQDSMPQDEPAPSRRDMDTHPGADQRVKDFVDSRGDISPSSVGTAIKSSSQEDLAWAAAASHERSKQLWALHGNAVKSGDLRSADRIKSDARQAEVQHELAMGKIERMTSPTEFGVDSSGSSIIGDSPVKLSPIASNKRYASEGDNASIVKNGIVKTVTRFLNSHNLTLEKGSDGSYTLSKSPKSAPNRDANRAAAKAAYADGVVYDKHDLNPHAKHSSGVVGGLPFKQDLYWRPVDSIAHAAPSIDFSGTRVAVHSAYNKALTSGNSDDVRIADEAISRHYADRAASNRESHPNEIGIFGEEVWGQGNRISSASADEIHKRAAEAVATGKFNGRVREFTSSGGDRVLRMVYDRNSPDKFEDYMIDSKINHAPEVAKRTADRIAVGAVARAIVPRKVGTAVNANDVVDSMIDKLTGQKSEKAKAQLDFIHSNREQVVSRIRNAMNNEFVKSDREESAGLVADLGSVEKIHETPIAETVPTETSARAALRGAARAFDNSDSNHFARELFNMTPTEQTNWLREYTGNSALGQSAEATHQTMLDAIGEHIDTLMSRASAYRKYISRTDISAENRLKAKHALNKVSGLISAGRATFNEYSRMMEQQSIGVDEANYEDDASGVAHVLAGDGARSYVLPGHVSPQDAYSLIEKGVAKPVFKKNKLHSISYWDSKVSADGKTTRSGKIHYVPIDFNVDHNVLTASGLGNGSVGNYDMAKAEYLATKIIVALNVDQSHYKNIHFVTAKELLDKFGFDNGYNGDAGLYDPATGQSFIITDKIASVGEFVRIVTHEVGAHAGLFGMIADRADRIKLFDQLMSNQAVMDRFAASGHPAFKHMANYSQLSDELRDYVGNEVFASVFEHMRLNKDGKFVIGSGSKAVVVGGIVDKVAGALQSGFNKILKALGVSTRMSNAQVRNLIAHVVARNGSVGARAAANTYQTNYNGYNNLATWQLGAMRRIRRDYQDHAVILKMMQDSITNMGRMIPSNQDVHAAVTDAVNTSAAYFNRFQNEYFKPLVKSLADNKVDYKRFDEFLLARHALERNAFHAGKIVEASGWKDADATAVLRKLEVDGLLTIQAGPNGNTYGGLYGTLGKKVEDIAKVRLDILLHGHMITKTEYDNVTKAYKYYMPMADTEELPSTTPGIGGLQLVGGGKDVKFAAGRSQQSGLGLVQSLHNVGVAIRRVEQNKVYQHFDRLIAANPNAQAVTRLSAGTKVNPNNIAADGILSVKYNGVERLLLIHNADIARALKGGTPQECGTMLNVMRKFNSFLVKMNVVYSPTFIPVNQWRDGMTAFAHLASRKDIGGVDGMEVFKRMGSAYVSASRFAFSKHVGGGSYDKHVDVGGQQVKLSTLYKEYENSGAKPGFVFSGTVNKYADDFKSALERSSGGGVGAGASRFVHAAGDFASSMSEASESSTRFSAYVAMRQSGIDSVTAGRECKELTVNFSRRGEKTSVLNALYLFANAGIQDAAMITKLMVGGGKVNKRGLTVAAGIASFSALLAAACRAAGDDDEGTPLYDKLSDNDKRSNIILPPVKGVFGKIPQAYGFGLFFSIGRIVSDAVSKEKMGGGKYTAHDAGLDLFAAVLHSFNPIGGEFEPDQKGFIHGLTPQIGKIPLELYTNSNYFGAPIRPDNSAVFDERGKMSSKYNIPNHLNHGTKTSPLAKATADGLAKLGFDTSPDNLDHTAESVFGATGKFVMQTIAMMTTGTATPINNVPIVRRFLGTPPDYIDNRNFKSNVSDIKATKNEYDRIRLDPAYAGDVKKFQEDNLADIRAANALPGYESRLHTLYTERKKATTHDAVAKINSSIRRLHQEFNAHYYALQAK